MLHRQCGVALGEVCERGAFCLARGLGMLGYPQHLYLIISSCNIPILELERRFYRNDSEYCFEGSQRQIDLRLELSERELGCMYLDLRTLLNASIMNLQG